MPRRWSKTDRRSSTSRPKFTVLPAILLVFCPSMPPGLTRPMTIGSAPQFIDCLNLNTRATKARLISPLTLWQISGCNCPFSIIGVAASTNRGLMAIEKVVTIAEFNLWHSKQDSDDEKSPSLRMTNAGGKAAHSFRMPNSNRRFSENRQPPGRCPSIAAEPDRSIKIARSQPLSSSYSPEVGFSGLE